MAMWKTRAGGIVGAILIFISGVLFAYYTYPFFNALISAADGVTATAFEGWEDIKLILWAGYFVILVLWILVFPAYSIFATEDQQ